MAVPAPNIRPLVVIRGRHVATCWPAGGQHRVCRYALAQAGYSEAELLAGAITPAFRTLMDHQIARAQALYDASLPGIALLHPDSRFAIASSAAIYRGILPKIVANDYDVFSRRAHLTLREKLLVLPPTWRQYRTED